MNSVLEDTHQHQSQHCTHDRPNPARPQRLNTPMKSTSEYQASVAVWQYCPLVLFAFGTFGNLMTVVILRRMNLRRSAMPVYLTALALSDTCLLYTGLLRYWVLNVFRMDVRALHPAVCKVHTWLVYSLIIISAWLLSIMTVERTVSVWRPHQVALWCTRSKAVVLVVSVVLLSLMVNSHLLHGMTLVTGPNGTTVHCVPDEGYTYFFQAVWSWADLTLASLLPFTLLLLGNCLILWKVSLSVRAARYLGSARPHDVSQRQRKTSSMTVMLVALSVIFFVTTSPICVFNIIEHYLHDELVDDRDVKARLGLAWAVVNILMYTNSTVNFYLYCLSGAKFRQELRRCLCCFFTSPWSPSKNQEVVTMVNLPGNHHLDNDSSACPQRCQHQYHHDDHDPRSHPHSLPAARDGRHRGTDPAPAECHHRVLLAVSYHPAYHSTCSAEF